MNTSPRFLLRIPMRFYEEMLDEFLVMMPNECCGLLAGRINDDGKFAVATEHYPLFNALVSPTEFLSEPGDMLAAVKNMRTKQIDVLAVYHSHPESEAIPSKRDIERNYSPNVMNLIFGMANEEMDIRAWWISDLSFTAAQWELFNVS